MTELVHNNNSNRHLNKAANNNNDDTVITPPPPKLFTYNDLPLAAHQNLKEQFKAHDKSTGRLLTFLKSYNEINRAYAQSLKRLATSNLSLEEQEDNQNVRGMYSRLRALIKNESVQVLNLVDAMNIDVIQPVKKMKEKNGNQHDSAITEINKLLNALEKDKRSYLSNARKTEKAIDARKMAIIKQVDTERKMDQQEQRLHLQKVQQQKKLLKQLQSQQKLSGVGNNNNNYRNDDEVDEEGGGERGEENGNDDDNGSNSNNNNTKEVSSTSFSTIQPPRRQRRGTVTTAKIEEEDKANKNKKNKNKTWSLPPWMRNKHIVLSEDEVNRLKKETELLKIELNSKANAATQTARSFYMIWQASERRRVFTVNNSMKKACIIGVSRLANTTYDMNQLCKALEDIEFGTEEKESNNDTTSMKASSNGSTKERTKSLHKLMDAYFHDFVKEFVTQQ